MKSALVQLSKKPKVHWKGALLLLSILFIANSCVKENPEPIWIKINAWELQENPDNQAAGELTANISNVTIYINGDHLGIFQVPCEIPVLKSGQLDIQLYPTILNNGISATKRQYPFLNGHSESLTASPGDKITLNPKTSYKTGALFWIEDFENAPSVNIVEQSGSEATLVIEQNTQNTYGKVVLNSSASLWKAATNIAIDLKPSRDAYLEVDYYNTNNIVTGLVSIDNTGTQTNHVNIQMNAQDPNDVVWKKIYIDLKELVTATQGIEFLQSFTAVLDEGDSEGLILIDNIKVVYYP